MIKTSKQQKNKHTNFEQTIKQSKSEGTKQSKKQNLEAKPKPPPHSKVQVVCLVLSGLFVFVC